jgi:hypothetical protein
MPASGSSSFITLIIFKKANNEIYVDVMKEAMTDFDFEVAFSLLDEDVKIAEILRTKLGSGDSIFLYTTNSKELKFKNAIPVLEEIYRSRSRLVIVLHREEYGRSGWTLIEKEAITSRKLLTQKFSTPYSFIILNMDSSSVDYIGRNYIHEKFDVSNIDVVVALIEHKLKELNGFSMRKSPKEIIDVLNAEKKWRTYELPSYLKSNESAEDIKVELDNLYNHVFSQFDEIFPDNKQDMMFNKRSRRLASTVVKKHYHIGIDDIELCLQWEQKYPNVLLDSFLRARLYEVEGGREKRLIGQEEKYYFQKYRTGDIGWATSIEYVDYCSTNKLGSILIDRFVQAIQSIN